MDKEILRMQMLAGIITESQYKEKIKEIVNVAPSIVANYLSRNQQDKPSEEPKEKPIKKPGCGEEGCEGGFTQDKPGGGVYSMCKKCNGSGKKKKKGK